jgi:hypothetical protein
MSRENLEGGLSRTLVLLFMLSFALSASLATAQIGEQAGDFWMQVPVGGNSITLWHIFNTGSQPVGYYTITPFFNSVPNETTPTVILVPSNGTLPADSSLTINVIVTMPRSNTPNNSTWWSGLLQIREVALVNSSNSSGGTAVIQAGLAKSINVAAAPSTTSTTSATTTIPTPGGGLQTSQPTSPISQTVELAWVAIVIIAVVGAYGITRRNAQKGKSKKKHARKTARKRKSSKKSTRRRAPARRRRRRRRRSR